MKMFGKKVKKRRLKNKQMESIVYDPISISKTYKDGKLYPVSFLFGKKKMMFNKI